MVKFKEGYENSIVSVRSNAIGLIKIDTSQSNPNHWAHVPEFAFMLEKIEGIEAPIKAPIKVKKTIKAKKL